MDSGISVSPQRGGVGHDVPDGTHPSAVGLGRLVGAPEEVAGAKLDTELLPGIGAEAELNHPLEVVTGGLHDGVEQEPGVVQEHGRHQDEEAEGEGDGGEHLNTPVKTEHDGDVRHEGHHDDRRRLRVEPFEGGVRLVLEGSVVGDNLVDAEAEGGAHAKGGARDGHGIDDVTDGGVDEVAEERVERGPHGEGHVPPVAHNAEAEGDGDVGSPRVETPVVEGLEESLLRALVVVRDIATAVELVPLAVVRHGLGDAEGVHADGDAAREEHGEPRDVVELGLLVSPAELDFAVLGEGDVEEEDGPRILERWREEVRGRGAVSRGVDRGGQRAGRRKITEGVLVIV